MGPSYPGAEGNEHTCDSTRRSYDAVAGDYDAALAGELAAKPLDRALLSLLAEDGAGGAIADLGCGPGHIGAALAGRGCEVVGIDLSTAMCTRATARHVPAAAGDLTALPLRGGSLAGALCWYAVIHLDRAGRGLAYAELARVLAAGATAIVGFHVSEADVAPGEAVVRRSWFDRDVDVTFRFLDPDDEIEACQRVGLDCRARIDRCPYPEEHPSNRTYLLLHKI